MDLLYHHVKYGGHRGCRVGCSVTQKCDVFCLFVIVTLWNYEVCDNGNAMKQYNFQNNYGTVA